MKPEIFQILDLVKQQQNRDFFMYSETLLEKQILSRINETRTQDFLNYFEFLKKNVKEIENFINALTINFSRFFRNSFTFEYLGKVILPQIISQKVSSQSFVSVLRIWSAGCSYGEEPYSVAILVKEFFEKNPKLQIPVQIFATDINDNVIQKALKGEYSLDSIANVKYYLLSKYFSQKNGVFKINQSIKDMVKFSIFDITDKEQNVPIDCGQGEFDMILCRNVIIYFNPQYLSFIFDRLHKALDDKGFLILGSTECPDLSFRNKYFKENSHLCKVYQKMFPFANNL